jgi:FkbH-like protein
MQDLAMPSGWDYTSNLARAPTSKVERDDCRLPGARARRHTSAMQRGGGPELAGPLRDIRLVIWDLDDTLWKGTLSEGSMERNPQREELVRALSRSGVVNSVASNNDEHRVNAILEQIKLADEFVFSEISWGSKVPMVERILRSSRLQPGQILFVDDNARLRAEVELTCGVRTTDPHVLDDVDPSSILVTDPRRERLVQFRTMERRDQFARLAAAPSARDFLRTCDLRAHLFPAAEDRDRLVALAGRANQLNFTKRALSHSDLDLLIADPEIDVRGVAVSDRFGSYGTVGLYAFDRSRHLLLHLLFSCRLLNTWVEHAVHAHLGHPSIGGDDGTIAARLAAEAPIDWVTVIDASPPPEAMDGSGDQATKILLVGGCDLETMATYISLDHVLAAQWHVPQVVDGQRCELQSSLILLDPMAAHHADDLDQVPGLANWRPPSLDKADVVVLSLWVEMASTRLRHRDGGWIIPWLPAQSPPVLAGDAVLSLGSDQFEDIGALPVAEVASRTAALAASLRDGAVLAVMNLPEVGADQGAARARSLNRALDDLAAEGTIHLIDVRAAVPTTDHLAGDGIATHYARPVYAQLAAEIRGLVSAVRTGGS